MLNEKTMSVKLRRHDVIRLMLSCTNLAFDETLSENARGMWKELHDKLKAQLEEFDEKHKDEE